MITVAPHPRTIALTRLLLWVALASIFGGGFSARGHGDLDIRIAAATLEITKHTNSASLYLQRAELYREHKDWPAALADYDRTGALDTNITTLDFYRGRMYADANRLEDALKSFNAHLMRHPQDGNAYVERARTKDRLNDHAAAVEDFTRGLELVREPQPEFFLERSQSLLSLGKTNDALVSLDEGIKKLGPVVTLQVCAIDIEMAAKRYDESIARLNTIIPQAARKENWLARRGEIEVQAGRLLPAQRSFVEALRSIDILPARLQLNRPMADLRARINQALIATTNKSETPKK